MENVNTAPVATEPQGVATQGANQPTNEIPGAAPGETKAETLKRMHKITVDGSEMEVDDDELKRGYSHNKAAEKKMQEAAMSKKEAAEVMRMLREQPKEAMRRLGLNPRQFAEMVINEELQEAMLSPKDRELRDYKAQVARYQADEQRAMQEYKQQQQEAETARLTEQIQTQMIDALQSSGIPQTSYTVMRIIHYMEAADKAGFHDITPQDVIEHVKKDYYSDFKAYLGAVPEDAIEALLGSDVVGRIAKSTVAKGMPNSTVPKTVNAGIQRKPAEKKVLSPREYFKRK